MVPPLQLVLGQVEVLVGLAKRLVITGVRPCRDRQLLMAQVELVLQQPLLANLERIPVLELVLVVVVSLKLA